MALGDTAPAMQNEESSQSTLGIHSRSLEGYILEERLRTECKDHTQDKVQNQNSSALIKNKPNLSRSKIFSIISYQRM